MIRKKVKTKPAAKRTGQPPTSTNGLKQVWLFDSVDSDGPFCFDPKRDDMNCVQILEKIIQFSKRTWQEVIDETSGTGKSKHHYLTYGMLGEQAKERIAKLYLGEATDAIFSMRLDGKTRIIGLREGQNFSVKWFDPNHEFCPVSRD